jgi:hypothetical protein
MEMTWFYLQFYSPRIPLLDLVWSRVVLHVVSHLRSSTNVKTSCAIPGKDGILKFNQYEPDDKFFTDQFVVHTPGRCLDVFTAVPFTPMLHPI